MEKSVRNGLFIAGGFILLAGVLVYRNRYAIKTTDKTVLNYKNATDKLKALGASAVTLKDGSVAYRYGQYQFYTNGRVVMADNFGSVTKKGSYDVDNVSWDDKSKIALKDIFNTK
jgi:hypothetical protein